MSGSFRQPTDAVAFHDALTDPDRFVALLAERDRWLEDFLNSTPDQECYNAQLLTGDFTSAANVEATVITLGPQLFLGSHTYEIRAMVSVKGSLSTTRAVARILNVTDTLRLNICDVLTTNPTLYTTYYAIYRFFAAQDVVKEFAITAQNAAASGTLTVCGSPPGPSSVGPGALLTANRVAGN